VVHKIYMRFNLRIEFTTSQGSTRAFVPQCPKLQRGIHKSYPYSMYSSLNSIPDVSINSLVFQNKD